VTVLLDSQAVIIQIQNTESEPDQALAIQAHEAARWLQEHQVRVTIQWVPGHAGIEGNKQADQAAKWAVARPSLPWDPEELSLAHAQRGLTETWTEEHKH
jgi:ribonuclease HI